MGLVNGFDGFRYWTVASAIAAAMTPAAGPAALAAPVNQSVTASYVVTFAGLKLGKFTFSSVVRDGVYDLRGVSKMKAAFGAFKWKSNTRSTGRLANRGPVPEAYDFSYKMNSKSGFTKMTFADGSVASVKRKPNKKSSSRIPVTKGHLKDVLDPMAAILSLSQQTATARAGGGANTHPCKRRVSVFDGKQRFDLILSPKRTERLRPKSSGAPTKAFVCKVTYKPISGHKMNRSTKFMVANDDIETWMMPIPQAGIYAPYRIVLPILVGSAVIDTRRLVIRTEGREALNLAF